MLSEDSVLRKSSLIKSYPMILVKAQIGGSREFEFRVRSDFSELRACVKTK